MAIRDLSANPGLGLAGRGHHKLRVVLALSDPPLPFGAPGARWFYTLFRGLTLRGHSVTALVACGTPEEIELTRAYFPEETYDIHCYLQPMRGGLHAKWETLCRPHSYRYSDQLRKDLKHQLAQGFDIVQLEHLWTGWLDLYRIPTSVLNVHFLTAIDEGNYRDSLRREMIYLRTLQTERKILRLYPNICTFSTRDSEHVQCVSPRSTVYTVPLGMDTSLYSFPDDLPQDDRPVVSLIGSFGWAPTQVAAQRLISRLWPEIKRRVPAARLQLVGREARRYVGHVAGSDVIVEENVPDIVPYFSRTRVLLYAPGRASGMKVKVLEAFALGAPVVTTPEGTQGIPAQDGVHAGICDDDEGLIERTAELLTNFEKATQQRRAARLLVESHCGTESVLDRVEQVYFDVLQQNRAA